MQKRVPKGNPDGGQFAAGELAGHNGQLVKVLNTSLNTGGKVWVNQVKNPTPNTMKQVPKESLEKVVTGVTKASPGGIGQVGYAARPVINPKYADQLKEMSRVPGNINLPKGFGK